MRATERATRHKTALALALKLSLIAPKRNLGPAHLVRRSANQTRIHRRRQTETDGRAVPDCDNGFCWSVVSARPCCSRFAEWQRSRVTTLLKRGASLCVGCVWASLVLYWSMHVGKRAVRSATSCLEMKQCVCRAFAVHMYVQHRRLSRPVNVVAYQRFLESSLWDANASESRQQVRFLSTLLLPLPSRGTL